MAYVPPHLRNKNPTPSSFPKMEHDTIPKWNGTKSFAVLANEWNEKDENDKMMAEIERKKEISNKNSMPAGITNLYRIRRQTYEEDNNEYDDTPTDEIKNDESEWTDVKRKVRTRKIKTVEDIIAEEEQERIRQQEEDNMWVDDGPETHETYWDQKY